jgi:uncharacterized protein YerC
MNYEHFKLAAAVADDVILYGACRCFCHRIRHIRRRLYQDFMAEPGASTALFPKMVRSLIPSAQSGTMKKRATPPANQAARIHCAFRAGDRADGETLAAISKSYGVSIAMISRL